MNRFVFFYCLELIALLVLMVMPNDDFDSTFGLIIGVISFVLVVILFSIKESQKLDIMLMIGLLTFLFWFTLYQRFSMIEKYEFD